MKKLLAIMLVIVLIVGVVACSPQKMVPQEEAEIETPVTEEQETEEEAVQTKQAPVIFRKDRVLPPN